MTKQEMRNYKLSTIDFEQKNEEEKTCICFDELLSAFENEKRIRVRQSTYLSYSVSINRFIRPVFSGKKLEDIGPSDIRAWQNGMMQIGYSSGYLRKVDSVLSAIFNYGIRFYGLRFNPAKQAGTLGCQNEKKVNYWTPEEFELFIKNVNDPRYHLIYNILYWTGIRVGELLALTREDIDLEEQCIKINKSYRRYHKEDIISPPKTRNSYRAVYYHETLGEEIAAYLKNHACTRSNERIFPVCQDSLRDRLYRIVGRIGLKRIKIHDFRHSHASVLIISERLGHERVETTLNIYSHLYPDVQKKLVEELDSKVRPL